MKEVLQKPLEETVKVFFDGAKGLIKQQLIWSAIVQNIVLIALTFIFAGIGVHAVFTNPVYFEKLQSWALSHPIIALIGGIILVLTVARRYK